MSIRVLVTEPDFLLAKIYEQFLTRKGFEVLTATSGRQCIERLQEGKPDVLILETDIRDGPATEILQSMKRDTNGGAIPVVIVTRRKSSVGSIPFEAMFVKPVAMEELSRRLEIVVEANAIKQT